MHCKVLFILFLRSEGYRERERGREREKGKERQNNAPEPLHNYSNRN